MGGVSQILVAVVVDTVFLGETYQCLGIEPKL
jgi:hypothetical protein